MIDVNRQREGEAAGANRADPAWLRAQIEDLAAYLQNVSVPPNIWRIRAHLLHIHAGRSWRLAGGT